MRGTKLFVYGCSFSENFNDYKHIPKLDKGWPDHLAELFNYELVNRAEAGKGIHEINLRIDKDIFENNIQPDDLMIISPSYFQRTVLPEIEYDKPGSNIQRDFKSITNDNGQIALIAKYGIDENIIYDQNRIMFYSKLRLLNKAGYRAYGWIWDNIFNREIHEEHLIPTPDGYYNWDKWQREDKNINWRIGKIPPGSQYDNGTVVEEEIDDTHFSAEGHRLLANYFRDTINIEECL